MSAAEDKSKEGSPGATDESEASDDTLSDSSGAATGNADDVEPGMTVEAREGDLGEDDVSHAKVQEVERDDAGDVTNVVVEKGVVFRKKLEIPPERIDTVEVADNDQNAYVQSGAEDATDQEDSAHSGKVVLNATTQEIRDLSATGSEKLSREAPEQQAVAPGRSASDTLKPGDASGLDSDEQLERAQEQELGQGRDAEGVNARTYLRTLGPGLLSGMAGNDSSAVTSYSVSGATNGYGQLWLLLLATPLYQAVQYSCAKIGRITQKGLSEILREHYGQKVAIPASLILVLANTALIAADLVAIGAGFQLITGIAWEWFVAPVALGLWYLVVYKSFGVIKRIFLAMSLAFAAYLVTALFSKADWGLVLRATFVPHLQFNLASVSTAVALLGATVSPYTMYWQTQGEKEQKRPGNKDRQFKLAALDILSGTISGNLVAYAIIVCTAATIFTHHETIQTAEDAARALAPLLGNYAKYLFAIGFIGAGLIAIPVLMASTSYGLSGNFGWSASLWKKPWQSEGFYLIMTGALCVSLLVALLRFDPIELMFWANVLQGVLAPVLIVFLFMVGNNRKIMGSNRLGRFTNAGLILIALVMAAAAALLFYGLFTGKGA